jgi:hypothetical protein
LDKFGIGAGFKTIGPTALAAKLQLMRDLRLAQVSSKAEPTRQAQTQSLRRPFRGKWHNELLFDNAMQKLARFTAADRRNVCWLGHNFNFQMLVRRTIVRKRFRTFFKNASVKEQKMWKFRDPPGHVAARCVETLRAALGKMSAAVRAKYMRALWKGIPTSRCTRKCLNFKIVACVFAFSEHGQDSSEQDCRCPKLLAVF